MNVTILLLTLLVGAIATYISGKKPAAKVALLFGLVAFVETIVLICQHNAGTDAGYMTQWISNPNIHIALKADGLALALTLLTTALTPIIIFSSFGDHIEKSNIFYSLVMFMSFAMTGTFLAADGLLYYVFWELSLLPIYFIALLWGNDTFEVRKKAILKFFIYTFAGSLFMLVGFIYLYSKTGSFLLQDLYNARLTGTEQYWVFLAFFLAYAIKIPVFPFHTWQASTYEKAPTVGTMLLAGIMLKMGLYSVIRWQIPITPIAAKEVMPTILVLSIIGVVYGSIVALKQANIKRFFAYSSLAHVGLIAAGAYTLTLDGMKGAVLQMIAHGFVIVGLFFVGEIIYRRYQTRMIGEMGGIRQQAPKFASIFMILMFASIGLPGTFSFIGEFNILYGLSQINLWYAVIGGTTLIFGAFYMLRMFQKAMLGETNAKPFADLNTKESIILGVLAIVIIFLGIYPKPLADLITPSLVEIVSYIK
ncbi:MULTISPECIES: NuoM family protein [Myroides]|uniref:NADH-quinone oxidoreductase subunit M n=1 Tax=Myroides albus TaxID=2562892 RepID=A0A6I3LFM1_9FLAO|nr:MULTISPECIES: NADH-quinone oxidoreductase subunit M [Myroides]MTG96707.1 NADH-quinone oxidoreductase subunit M [Myroides albus]MVX35651.1 NADH-quinone oxidoreductase subunit M [Myroides sp. LoEW2-1]UVD80881.1 NADH-quinone oxidoreductase subunit M [Myroides albus]